MKIGTSSPATLTRSLYVTLEVSHIWLDSLSNARSLHQSLNAFLCVSTCCAGWSDAMSGDSWTGYRCLHDCGQQMTEVMMQRPTLSGLDESECESSVRECWRVRRGLGTAGDLCGAPRFGASSNFGSPLPTPNQRYHQSHQIRPSRRPAV